MLCQTLGEVSCPPPTVLRWNYGGRWVWGRMPASAPAPLVDVVIGLVSVQLWHFFCGWNCDWWGRADRPVDAWSVSLL